MVRRFLIKVLVSALALWAADYFLAGLSVAGGITGYLIAGLVLGTLNTFIRPVLKLLTLPLILLSLGSFTVVINALILWSVPRITTAVSITGLWTLLWATLIVSVVNMLFEPNTDK
ncbi:MAG: phage holin family protein [Patescibacteria group bacterium]